MEHNNYFDAWTSIPAYNESFPSEYIQVFMSKTAEVELPDTTMRMSLIEDLLGYNLRRAAGVILRDFAETIGVYDIRPTQYAVLSLIALNPGLKQTEVAEALGIKRANFVPLFDTLEARRLAVRKAVPYDRRSYALYLTEAGHELVREMREKIVDHEAKFLARMTDGERDTMLSVLKRIWNDSAVQDASWES